MPNGRIQQIRQVATGARDIYNNLGPGWRGVAAATTGAVLVATLYLGYLGVTRTWPYVKEGTLIAFYTTTGLEKPDIWGEKCKYLKEATISETNTVRDLYRGRDGYRPVLINCDQKEVVAALEGTSRFVRKDGKDTEQEMKIKSVRLANSRESDITVGGKRFVYAQKGTYSVDLVK